MMFADVIPTALQKRSKLPFVLDFLSCVGAIGGLLASLLTQQVMVAIIALTLVFVAQVINHSQQGVMLRAMDQKAQQSLEALNRSLHELDQAIQTQNVGKLKRMIEANDQAQKDETEALSQEMKTKIKDLEAIVEKLHALAAEKPALRKFTLNDHYKHGFTQEELGNLEGAIAAYTRVLEQKATHAFALYRRGLTYLKLGQTQAALSDLNIAAQQFFGEGDITHYEMATEKANAIEIAMQNSSPQERVKVKSNRPANVSPMFGLG